MWAIKEASFNATAVNIAQVDWTCTSTKVSTTKSHSICWHKSSSDWLKPPWKTTVLTFSGVSQLSTYHSSIITSPGAITHSAPHTVHTDLHSAFICNITSCQSQLTTCTRSWREIRKMPHSIFVVTSYLQLLQHLHYLVWYRYLITIHACIMINVRNIIKLLFHYHLPVTVFCLDIGGQNK